MVTSTKTYSCAFICVWPMRSVHTTHKIGQKVDHSNGLWSPESLWCFWYLGSSFLHAFYWISSVFQLCPVFHPPNLRTSSDAWVSHLVSLQRHSSSLRAQSIWILSFQYYGCRRFAFKNWGPMYLLWRYVAYIDKNEAYSMLLLFIIPLLAQSLKEMQILTKRQSP